MSLSYSDGWRREGHQFEKQIMVKEPVYYRHVYAGDGSLAGVIVDYELADDFHYELTSDAWKMFSERCLKGDDELQGFQFFLTSHPGLFAFEDMLKAENIDFKKLAF